MNDKIIALGGLGDKIEEEYFMNQLYVAVSRAKTRLYIIDTERGIDQFWLKLDSYDQRRKYYKIVNFKRS